MSFREDAILVMGRLPRDLLGGRVHIGPISISSSCEE